ncbi:MAG: helix-turn-helix domain-containing protein [Lachnospiraceae bacterium]|nr:helix-turn-helix domain-containing protein [Lachnospiraceae bacterium]
MSETDLKYVVRSISALSGIPARLYEHGVLCCSEFPARFPKDPLSLYEKDVLAIHDHVGYFVTPLFHYYGVINTSKAVIVTGPTSQVMGSEQDLRKLAFQTDVPHDEVPAFIAGMNAIARLPVETLLQILCTINYFLNNGEKLNVSDVTIHEDEQKLLKEHVEKKRTERVYDADPENRQAHNTLALEETLMDFVRRGDTAALRGFISQAPGVHGGTIAPNQLRQLKNTFVVSATLASRAAIRGGLSEDGAFALSDGYIQRAELLSDHASLLNLQYSMILEFTEQVEKLRRGSEITPLKREAANYVRNHLSEPIRVEHMASELYLSRPYLSARFKEETGETLTDFILREKTEEAKRLLRYSDKPASSIGSYLGFSSHGHFIRVFKKYAGSTPNEYREKHR